MLFCASGVFQDFDYLRARFLWGLNFVKKRKQFYLYVPRNLVESAELHKIVIELPVVQRNWRNE